MTRELSMGKVNIRRRLLAQTDVFGVADDTHNLAHQPATIVNPNARPDALAEWVLVRKITERQGLIDDRHLCGSQFIARCEITTFDQLYAHCLEVARRDGAKIC